MMWLKTGVLSCSLVACSMISLVGCQLNPTQTSKPSKQPSQATTETKVKTPDGIKITPYERAEIIRENMQVITPPPSKAQQKFDDGRDLPAFKQLMQKTQTAFKQAKWNEAEQAAMQAQRLAPQSSETYMYLAMIANQKNQAKNAEALARRGLSYAQTDAMKRQLWMVILKSGQLQKKAQLIQEAQNKLKSY